MTTNNEETEKILKEVEEDKEIIEWAKNNRMGFRVKDNGDREFVKELGQRLIRKAIQKALTLAKEEQNKKIEELLNKIVLAERKYDLNFSEYIICKFCGTIAYGNGDCHCGKNEWTFWEMDFNKKIKQLEGENAEEKKDE